ncbi:hypothetical protein B0H21DRAFT_825261 [Amylocystis lapponica]|nr:hypothetical protein B0H21DRAFT_825261 [Amylocystis lapponica]
MSYLAEYKKDGIVSKRSNRADTILKSSHTLSSTHIATKADAVDGMVQHELKYNSHVAATDAFLDKLLDVKETTVDRIYGKLVESGNYNPNKALWRDFPQSKATEQALYEPFTAAANAVNEACTALGLPVEIQTSWLDRHNTAPKSRDTDAPAIRPDIVSVLGATKDLKELDTKIYAKEEAACLLQNADLGAEQQADELAQAWWHRVHVPVEIKLGKGEKDILSAVQQLCAYMRQVFREQLDRRFVFGLAFCATELSVWFCDRSGLIGTETAFDIHKEPKKFIQVIAALALLPPDRLGWDPSMWLYRPSAEEHFVHSWESGVKLEDFGSNAYRTYWAFDMPSRDGKTRERFISVHGLSLVRSEIMCGRATLVWEVVRDDEEAKDETRYVLKQCWRPMSSHRESYFYEHARSTNASASLNVGKVYSSEDVHIGAEVDTTLAMRRGLTLTPTSITDEPVTGKRDRGDTIERFIHVQTTAGGSARFSAPASDPNPRVLSRMLMETYGWPIKFFKDIPELLRVIRDAITGHRTLYYGGVLHRDISKTHGELIDLDYAKSTADFTPPVVFIDQEGWDRDTKEGYETCAKFLRPVQITEDAFYALWMRYGGGRNKITTYVSDILDLKEGLKNAKRPLTCEDLDIYYETSPRPDFSAHKTQVVARTATMCFASYEILKDRKYYLIGRAEHNSIHDMEAIFWVADYLCLTRDGPGGSRRKELRGEQCGGAANSLEQIVYCFFDSENVQVLLENRKTLFDDYTDVETYIVKQFHPYFDVLKPLVVEWWRLIRFAYFSGSYTPMHQPFLQVLNNTLREIEKSPPSKQSAATLAELERRRKDLSHGAPYPPYIQACLDSTAAAAAAEPSSPPMRTKKHKGDV